jgi:hypothetical protein
MLTRNLMIEAATPLRHAVNSNAIVRRAPVQTGLSSKPACLQNLHVFKTCMSANRLSRRSRRTAENSSVCNHRALLLSIDHRRLTMYDDEE